MRWQIVVMLALASAVAHAQPPDPEPPHAAFCLLGKDTCTTILLTETSWGLGKVIGGTDSQGLDLDAEAGLLVNTADHLGFGGSVGLHAIWDADELALIVRGRYRHWLSHTTGMDLSLGYLDGGIDKGGHGATCQIAAERADQIGLYAGVDVFGEKTFNGTNVVLQISFGIRFAGFSSIPAILPVLAVAGTTAN
ncbi:MAG TPA: hypothetical protein VLB44_14630 [Kofleriaceae bacterium]|nr:hypothetical protein [Kofleriaceae bacterium]